MSSNSTESSLRTYSNSTEVRTTRYAIKANIETTRYFDSPLPDIEQQVAQNTQDISTLSTNVSSLQITTALLDASVGELETEVADLDSSKESKTDHEADITALQATIAYKESTLAHNTDISTLQANINTKESTTDHNADIAALKSQISTLSTTVSNLNLGSPFEGYYYSMYSNTNTRAAITFNYNIGTMIFWPRSGTDVWATAINNNDENWNISSDITCITCPGTIKQISSEAF